MLNSFFEPLFSTLCNQSGERLVQLMKSIHYGKAQILDNGFAWSAIGVLVVSALVAALYYFVINHPRFKAWWSWLIMLAINAALSLCWGFFALANRLDAIQKMYPQKPFKKAVDGILKGVKTGGDFKKWTETLNFSDYFDVAIGYMWWGVICFLLISLIMMWFSSNAYRSPFRR